MLATAGGGNVDQGSAAVRYGGGNGKGLDYRVYGMGFSRGPEHHQDQINYDDWRMTQAGFRSDWYSGNGNTLTVQGDAYKGEDGERVAYSSYSPPSQVNVTGDAELSGGNIQGKLGPSLQ